MDRRRPETPGDAEKTSKTRKVDGHGDHLV